MQPSHPFWQKGLEWPCPVRSALKRTPVQDFNYFSIILYCIISTTYQKIGGLFCPVHISGFSHSVVCFEDLHCYRTDFRIVKVPAPCFSVAQSSRSASCITSVRKIGLCQQPQLAQPQPPHTSSLCVRYESIYIVFQVFWGGHVTS